MGRAILKLKRNTAISDNAGDNTKLKLVAKEVEAESVSSLAQKRAKPGDSSISGVLLLLRELWPKLFKTYKPLKIGIIKEIALELTNKGHQVEQTLLEKALSKHCRLFNYMKGVAASEFRYDLEGNKHLLSEDDRAFALRKLSEYQVSLEASRKKKKQSKSDQKN